MMFYTHLAFGFLAGLMGLRFLADIGDVFVFFTIVLVSSVLPDIDYKKSKVGRKTRLGWLVQWVFGHRGFFHSVFPALFLSGFLYLIGEVLIGMAVLIGYGAHLFSDGISKNGVYLFYPFTRLKLKGFVRTGKAGEYLVLGLVIYFSIRILISL